MLKPELVKDILDTIGEGEYVGVQVDWLFDKFVGDPDEAGENETQKFVYHMDELFNAGLFKARNLDPRHGWGLSQGIGGSYSITNVNLVLTPIGGETLEELKKPKGLQKFMDAIRGAGAVAGSEAVRYGIGSLFS